MSTLCMTTTSVKHIDIPDLRKWCIANDCDTSFVRLMILNDVNDNVMCCVLFSFRESDGKWGFCSYQR